MGIPTLIKTLTASNDASLSFVDGTSDVVFDSTYDEYMFVFYDIGPGSNGVGFTFQFNAASGSGYNETITSTAFRAYHTEGGASGAVAYRTGDDQAQGTAFQMTEASIGNGADESLAGILHVFSPSSTTYVTHFHARTMSYRSNDAVGENYTAGYVNATAAVDEIQFKMDAGNFDGVIQMYGIA
tara:strand:+ start:154 stop:705 length:552 start_codon:yes stop_codon:yes gene_type:complete